MISEQDVEATIGEKIMGLPHSRDPFPSYTTNITEAFSVLKKLHETGWFWRLDSVHDGVVCTLQNTDRKTFSVRSVTAPQAICECALRTVGLK